MTPHVFAQILQAAYEKKHYGGWTAKLISGPLFSFDGTDASEYLYNTYVEGTHCFEADSCSLCRLYELGVGLVSRACWSISA
jgi:hypothetical protein